MPNLLVLDIYFLLSGDGKGAGWIRLLHGGSVEDDGDTDVNNFIDLTTWRFGFPGGDIKVEMMPPSWNNFLRSLLHFVVVRSNHNDFRGEYADQSFFFFGGRKKKTEDTRKKKFLHFACRSVGRHSLGFCSRVCCRVFACARRVFACAAFYTKRHIGLELRI